MDTISTGNHILGARVIRETPTPSMPSPSEDIILVPEHRYALARPHGVVGVGEIERVGRAVAFHEKWQPGFTEVWDMTASEGANIMPTDIPRLNRLEDETRTQLEGSRTIVITPRSLELYSVQFYARLMRPRGRDVVGVRTREEAAEILGVDKLAMPPYGEGS